MNIAREAIIIPFIEMPIYWYGILFALGIAMATWCLYLTSRQINPKEAKVFTEKLSFYVIVGTVLGARLGHVFFYENLPYYLTHPHLIFHIREGGLASHGAVVGIFAAMLLFRRADWLTLLDLLVMPAAVAGFFIRIGNFINQEIIGSPTDLPWGVVFPMNLEGLSLVPRHPVQLYEAIYCLVIFAFLLAVWRFGFARLKKGTLGGLFLIVLFIGRFFFEFVKEGQGNGSFIGEELFSIGQWLSIPFILLGCALLWLSNSSGKLLACTELKGA